MMPWAAAAGIRLAYRSLISGFPASGYNPRSPFPCIPMSVVEPVAVAPTCPTETAVQLTDVSFGYDRRRPVLRGIDMTIPRGTVVAIMGGSGCGKTTILRLLGGQLRQQAGRVLVGGQSVKD